MKFLYELDICYSELHELQEGWNEWKCGKPKCQSVSASVSEEIIMLLNFSLVENICSYAQAQVFRKMNGAQVFCCVLISYITDLFCYFLV